MEVISTVATAREIERDTKIHRVYRVYLWGLPNGLPREHFPVPYGDRDRFVTSHLPLHLIILANCGPQKAEQSTLQPGSPGILVPSQHILDPECQTGHEHDVNQDDAHSESKDDGKPGDAEVVIPSISHAHTIAQSILAIVGGQDDEGARADGSVRHCQHGNNRRGRKVDYAALQRS